jgi:hypothetical protein
MVRVETVALAGTFSALSPAQRQDDQDGSSEDDDEAFIHRRKQVLGLTLTLIAIAQKRRVRARLPPVVVTTQNWAQYRKEKIERGTGLHFFSASPITHLMCI